MNPPPPPKIIKPGLHRSDYPGTYDPNGTEKNKFPLKNGKNSMPAICLHI